MIKGIIFDLDGVLVSTDELHFVAWKRIAEKIGVTDYSEEDNKRQKGVSRMESLEVILEKADKAYTEEEKLAFAEEKNEYYVELLREINRNSVLEGVFKTLEFLRQRGLKIGIGSASKNTPLILMKTELAEYIDEISCGLDVASSKPDPEVFLVAAKKLKLNPKECLVIEDSEAGIIAAKRANMKSLSVGPEFNKIGGDFAYLGLNEEINWEKILN